MSQVHAFFDFDDTLLSGDSILFWLRYYYRRRPMRRVFQLANWGGLILYVLRLIDSHTLKRIFLMPMGMEDPEILDRIAADFVREDLMGRFHVPVLQRLWTHHLLGHKVVLVSASATFYLRHLKVFLPMADIQGSEMIWPKRGFGIPRYRDGNLRGENKIARLKALGYAEAGPLSFAYSDHQHDRFLLRFSEFPICTHPTAKLRRLARENGWPVMDWPDPGSARPAAGAKIKLQKLALLALCAGPGIPPTGSDPLREAAAAREYAPAHCRALRERVLLRYPAGKPEDVFRRIFGEARADG
ncbi:MAG TPA: haloacid dehalogenase-like hydrolase [Fibrobacteria bacterium]|nr:haloacid dehalogenase-like hydrolase [Fibrobacteria bacterium]